MNKLFSVFVVFVFALLGSGCTEQSPTTQPSAGGDRRLNLVATVGMAGDLVRVVAGDRAQVRDLIGAGVDPHLFKPTMDDVARLRDADAVFYVGLHLEGQMGETLAGLKKPTVALAERIDRTHLLAGDAAEGKSHDPHVWMDVSLWSQAVDVIVQELSKLDPQGAADFQTRGAQLKTDLQKLHDYGRQVIATVPESGRVLITSHDAFAYLGRAYGLEVFGVQGLSTEAEASLQHVNGLVDKIVRRNVQAVFIESSVPAKNVQALVDGARSRGHTVRIGGELLSDAMGAAGTYEGTYLGMMDHNLTTIARALGGQAPERGMNGKLATP